MEIDLARSPAPRIKAQINQQRQRAINPETKAMIEFAYLPEEVSISPSARIEFCQAKWNFIKTFDESLDKGDKIIM